MDAETAGHAFYLRVARDLHRELADRSANRERKRIAARRIELADHHEADGALATSGNGKDAGFETVRVVDLDKARVDASIDALLIGFGGGIARFEDAIDHQPVDVERIAIDDRAARHVEHEPAFKFVGLRGVGEGGGERRLGKAAAHVHGNVEGGDVEIALRLRVIDAAHESSELWPRAVGDGDGVFGGGLEILRLGWRGAGDERQCCGGSEQACGQSDHGIPLWIVDMRGYARNLGAIETARRRCGGTSQK